MEIFSLKALSGMSARSIANGIVKVPLAIKLSRPKLYVQYLVCPDYDLLNINRNASAF
jgi:hypothetical protein